MADTAPAVPLTDNVNPNGTDVIPPPDPVNDKIFEKTQPIPNAFVTAFQTGFVNPLAAAYTAGKNALQGGPLGEDTLNSLRDAGMLNDYMNGENDFMKNVSEAILRPAAVGLDAALRLSNAVTTEPLAAAGQVITQEPARRAADHAQDFANYLYMASGLNEAGIPEAHAADMQSPLAEKKAIPPSVTLAKEEVTGPMQPHEPVQKENPALDESGNLNLKYINTSDDAKEVLAQTAQAYAETNGTVVPHIKSTEQAEQFFQDAMKSTGDGVPEVLADHLVADPVNRQIAGAARRYVQQAAQDFLDARNVGDEAASEAFGRLEQAQGIRHEITAETGRTLEFHKEVIGGPEGENLEKLAEKLQGMTPEEARHATAGLDTPQQVAKFVSDLKKPNAADMGLFFMMNNLLSGPITHAAYAASWAVQSLIRIGVETPMAAAVGKIQELSGKILKPEEVSSLTKEREQLLDRLNEAESKQGRPLKASDAGIMRNRVEAINQKMKWARTVTIGEAHARAYGMGEGSLEALRAFGRTIKTGNIQLLPGEVDKAKKVFQEKYEDAIKSGRSPVQARKDAQGAYNELVADYRNPFYARAEFIQNPAAKAFVKGVGTFIGAPFRVAGAIHTLQKFGSFYESRNALAFRHASSEGLKANELGDRIAKLKVNPSPEMLAQTVEEAQYSALIETSGKTGRALQYLANSTPYMRLILPFTKIPTNMLAQKFLERTPIGLAPFSPFWKQAKGDEGAAAQATAIGRMAAGTLLLSAGAWMRAQGYTTGEGPKKKEDRDYMQLIGVPPYSVRINGQYHPMRLFGVAGGALAIGADVHDVFDENDKKEGFDWSGAVEGAIYHLGNNFLEENALGSLAEIIDATREGGKRGEGFVSRMTASYAVPYSTFLNQTSKLFDDYKRQTSSTSFWEATKEKIQSRTPFLSSYLTPDVDVLGRPMRRQGDYEEMLKDPLIQEMSRLEYHPGRVEPRLGKENLTHEQFFDYQTKAGQTFAFRARQSISDPNWMNMNSDAQKKVLGRDMNIGRNCAKAYMMMKYPEITTKISKKNLALCGSDDSEE